MSSNFNKKNLPLTPSKLIVVGIILEFFYLLYVLLPKFFPSLINSAYGKGIIYIPIIASSIIFLIIFIWQKKRRGYCLLPLNPRKIIFSFFIIFSLTFIFAEIIGPRDTTSYLFYAKTYALYQKNPYKTAPADLPQDETSKNIFNFSKKMPSVYGPLFTLTSVPISALAKFQTQKAVLFFKLLSVCFLFFSLLIFEKISKLIKQNSNFLLLLFAWNPFILFQTAGEGHNDILMIFFILLAIYFLIKENLIFSALALTASILIKFISFILAPLFIIYALKNKQKYSKIIISIIMSIIITVLAFAPFGGLSTLENIKLSIKHLSHPQSFSFAPFIIYQFTNEINIIKTVCLILFFLFYFYILFKFPKNKKGLIASSFWIFFSYLLLFSFWLQAWYFVWLIPLALLAGYTKLALFISSLAIIHQSQNIFWLVKKIIFN